MTGTLRQRLVSIVAVLAFNLLANFCSAIAIAHFIFKDEWIIGIVPGAIALTAIVLQPWSLLLFLLLSPVTQPLHPFVTTLLTVLIYGWLNRRGKLERIKRIIRRFPASRLWKAGLIILIGSLGFTYARYRDFPAFKHQPPSTIQNAIERDKIAVKASYSYTIFSFLDSEYIWQAEMSPQNFAKLRESLDLKPIKQEHNRFFNEFKDRPPYWWKPTLSAKTQAYATPGFSDDGKWGDGVYIFLIWNAESQRVNLWLRRSF